jgi:hypothetical protein
VEEKKSGFYFEESEEWQAHISQQPFPIAEG